MTEEMELKIRDGQYVLGASGALETVDGDAEAVQRALMRLAARRGGFAPEPEYGSRLHTLCRLKPGQRAAAAQQFVRESLAPETEIAVRSVEYVPGADGEAVVRVALAVGETETELSVKV